MSDLSELKNLIQQQGEVFEQFKKTNDELLKAKAEGKAVGDLTATVERLNAKLTELDEAKAKVEETLVKLQRSSLGGGEGKADIALEVKQFNLSRRSNAPQGTSVLDVDPDAYTAYKSAYWNIFRKGSIDALSTEERKALQAGVDSDGGYLLPSPTMGTIVQKVYELSPIRQIAAVQTISTDALEGLDDNGEANAGWTSETGTRSDSSTPQVGKYRIAAEEMYAMPKATQKLLDDAAVDVEAWLAAKVADKLARVEGAAFVVGTGVGRPRGFASGYTLAETGDATRAWGQLEKVKTGANGDFAASNPADKLFDLIGAFKQAYLQNARFVTRREVITKIRKFKEATTNAYMWQPGLQAGQPDRLLGYPIVIAQDMPTLATGSASLAFGDFAQGYQIVDRIGIRTLRDPFTAKPYVVFYTTKRVGGGVLNFEAIKLLTFEA